MHSGEGEGGGTNVKHLMNLVEMTMALTFVSSNKSHYIMQAQEEFEREREKFHEKALEQQKQAVQREEELHSIIKQLKTELAKVALHSCIIIL